MVDEINPPIDDEDREDREVREINPYASANRWRHQESSSFSKHAGLSAAPKTVREADAHGGVSDLANFLNSSRIGPHPHSPHSPHSPGHRPIIVNGKANIDNVSKTSDSDVGTKTEKKKDESQDEANADVVNPADEHGGGPNWEKEGRQAGSAVDGKEVRCGPLINYRRIEGDTWFGSVLVVVRGGRPVSSFEPELVLRKAEKVDLAQSNGTSNGITNQTSYGLMNGSSYGTNGHGGENNTSVNSSHGVNMDFSKGSTANDAGSLSRGISVKGVKLYSDSRNIFWRFSLSVQMTERETEWAYEIPGLRFPDNMKKSDKQNFWVPAISESFRVAFFSCNGFSVGTDEEAWSGAALWNDVQRVHKETPFHVMIGGGDQIYNDGIRVNGPLRPWSDIPNPVKRKDTKFPESLREQCDHYFVANYIKWYSTSPFADANGRIPQLNLWDDHDIIDGFGSYSDSFMKCDVFRGIGGTAYKYYMLFQHHLAPPVSTYTTDAPQTMEVGPSGTGADPAQLKDTWVLQGEEEEPCYIIGLTPGPYVAEHSRSIYARLGARMAFFGIDARTERTRHQVNYPETYDLIFGRLRKELSEAKASNSPINHLIVLLGIPIAYPRLTWLENVLKSPLIGPVKFLNKRFGVAGSLFNKFDGSVDLLDDLDDHYTARTHKKERLQLVLDLQSLAAEFSTRVTILGGDVHLAAVGRFYSNPKLGIPSIKDHRYMVNIISSAIVNKPPPQAVANLLARRNKLHHLNADTDETLLKIFDRDPGTEGKTASSNHVTMPSRNWAMITENSTHFATRIANANGSSHLSPNEPSLATYHRNASSSNLDLEACTGKDGHFPLHAGEENAGSTNRAVTTHGKKGDGSLDVCIRVEKNQHDKGGNTMAYGMWIPMLVHDGAAEMHVRKRDAFASGHRPQEGPAIARSVHTATSHSAKAGYNDARPPTA